VLAGDRSSRSRPLEGRCVTPSAGSRRSGPAPWRIRRRAPGRSGVCRRRCFAAAAERSHRHPQAAAAETARARRRVTVRRLPGIGFPEAERCPSEKRACANRCQGLQPGVPSRTGPGQPNEISVLPVRRPLAVTAGLATPAATPMQTAAALAIAARSAQIVTSHTSCPRQAAVSLNSYAAVPRRLPLPGTTRAGLAQRQVDHWIPARGC